MRHDLPACPEPRELAEFLGFMSYCLGWRAEAAHEQQDGLWLFLRSDGRLPEAAPEVREAGNRMIETLYARVVTTMLRRFVTGASLQMAMVSRGMEPGDLAEASGVSVSTLRRWSDDPEVRAKPEAMRRVYNALQNRPADAPIGWPELAAGLVRS